MSPSLSLYLSPHPSDQVSERPHASTTALQCSEENEVKTSLDHYQWQCHRWSCTGQQKKSVCCCFFLLWSGMDWETRKLFGMDWEWSLKLQTWKGEREVAWADRSPVVWLPLAGAGYRRDNAPGPGVTLWSIDSRQPQFLQFGWREKVRILDLQRGDA